jgi:hypothetical protein
LASALYTSSYLILRHALVLGDAGNPGSIQGMEMAGHGPL